MPNPTVTELVTDLEPEMELCVRLIIEQLASCRCRVKRWTRRDPKPASSPLLNAITDAVKSALAQARVEDLARRTDATARMRPPAMHDPAIEGRRMLRLRDVANRIGMSRGTVYRMMNRGQFPKPVRIGTTSVRWREADIEAWVASKT